MAADAADEETPEEESGWDRRRALLLLIVVFLVLVGGGVGTFVLGGNGDGDGPGVQTPATDAPSSATPTLTPPDPTTPNDSGNVSFEFVDNATLVRAGNVVPGQSGATQRAIRNSGSMTATLAMVSLSVTDSENGLTDPESRVDDSADEGELSEAVLVRLSVTYPDGETATVFGGDQFVPLADVRATNESIGPGIDPGSAATLTLEYRIAQSAGNEIQSDTVAFDIGFQLRAPDTDG